MKIYELNYLISGDASKEEADSLQEKFICLVQDEKGIIGKENSIVKKFLSLPVKGHKQAYLGVLSFHLDPDKITEMENALKNEKSVIRHLLVNKKEAKFRPQKPRRMFFEKAAADKEKTKVKLKEIEEKLDKMLYESE